MSKTFEQCLKQSGRVQNSFGHKGKILLARNYVIPFLGLATLLQFKPETAFRLKNPSHFQDAQTLHCTHLG